jgi:hypothetical protein
MEDRLKYLGIYLTFTGKGYPGGLWEEAKTGVSKRITSKLDFAGHGRTRELGKEKEEEQPDE